MDLSLFERPAWQRHAACIGHPVDVFFPVKQTGRAAKAAVAAARQVCDQCPVRPAMPRVRARRALRCMGRHVTR